MFKRLRLVVTVCFLLTSFSFRGNAQAPFFKKIVFDKEQKDAKLSKIFQDTKGCMWLGTNVGICRYDGISFKYLEKDSLQVTAIAESNTGAIWMGHINGSIEYIEHNILKKFLPQEGLPKIKISAIVFDHQNRLWFSTYGEGIYCLDKNILYNINHDDGLTDDNVYDLMLAGDKLWAATDMGISVCSFQNGKKSISVINDKNGLPDNIVRSLKQDKAGNTWIALQDKGVCYIDKKSGVIKVPDEVKNWQYGQVNDILPLQREVFIGTEENGIIEIHSGLPLLNKMVPAKKKRVNAVQQLLLDKNEQVWMVADNLLSMANSNRFQIIEIAPEWQGDIKAITSDNDGGIWFSNAKGFFYKKDNNTPIQRIQLPGNISYPSIVCLYADDDLDIWFGTYNNGLYQYCKGANRLTQYTQKDGLIDNNVFSITGRGSELWLGTLGGASKMDMYTGVPVFDNYTKEDGLSNNYVYNVFIDRKGNKWFATDGSGISKMEDNVFYNYDKIAGLDNNIVYTITGDVHDNIWFTGRNSGLFVFDGKKFKRYGIMHGLHDNEILNLVADDAGNLLLTHPEGMEVFNIEKEYFTFYGAESGFENINPQINAYCITKKNAILIGAADRIIQYNAASTAFNQMPRLVMNNVSVFFNPVNFESQKTFSHDENHITLDYAGLWYANPDAVNYQYHLDGYSKDWINTKDHVITYPNLEPGKYTFRVKASVNNNFVNAPSISYTFVINKPFWKTAWFRIFIFLAAVVLIYFFINLRIRLVRYEEEKEKQKLQSQLDILKNQLNPHFLFNSFNTLLNIIDKDKQSATEFVEKLSDFYREILMHQDKEMVTVEEEISLLKNYIYLQQKRFGKNLQLSLNVFEEHLKGGIPPLSLQLLAENALKHNAIDENEPFVIRIESAQSFLIVSNNITRQEGNVKSTGIGLKNIQRRVQLLTGQEMKIVQSDKEFNVLIPIKKAN